MSGIGVGVGAATDPVVGVGVGVIVGVAVGCTSLVTKNDEYPFAEFPEGSMLST